MNKQEKREQNDLFYYNYNNEFIDWCKYFNCILNPQIPPEQQHALSLDIKLNIF